MAKKAVVAGATGLVGGELVRQLLSQASYERVVVLVRRRMDISHPKLQQIVISYDELDQLAPDLFLDADLFCSLGTTIKKAKTKENFKKVDYDYPIILGKMAKQHGADQMLVVTAMGASKDSLFFYSRVKGKLEVDLQALNLRSLHIFRPSLIVGDRQEYRKGEEFASAVLAKISFVFQGWLKRYKPIQAYQIANAMIYTARNPNHIPEIVNSKDMQDLADRMKDGGHE